MQISCKILGHTATVELSGELDQHSAPQVRDKLEACLDRGVTRIVYNMAGVTFMDSSGIGVILGRYRRLSSVHGSMDIVSAPESVNRILRMSGVYRLCTKEDEIYEK